MVAAMAIPAGPQPGGFATSAMASGIAQNSAARFCLVLLRPLISQATGRKIPLIVAPAPLTSELLPFCLVHVRKSRGRRRGATPQGGAGRRMARRGGSLRGGRFVQAETAHELREA